MKLLVLSDSHGVISYMRSAIIKEKPDVVVHLGDCVGDSERLREFFPDIRLLSVKGNNDWIGAPLEVVFLTDFGKIYMCHGHMLGVKSDLSNLIYTARGRGCSIALYGHTHRQHIEICDGVTVVNPGASMTLGAYAVCVDGRWELKTVI